MARCVVSIDGNKFFHSAEQLGFQLDYGRLPTLPVEGRDRVRAIFSIRVDEGGGRPRGFLPGRRRNGFRVVRKAACGSTRGDRKIPNTSTSTDDDSRERL